MSLFYKIVSGSPPDIQNLGDFLNLVSSLFGDIAMHMINRLAHNVLLSAARQTMCGT